MILVDTSIWIEHFRRGSRRLASLLDEEQVAMHPFVIGELACGTLGKRREILALLHALPYALRPEDDEMLHFIEARRLAGRGIGLVDMHLLASCVVGGHRLWTRDARLRDVAEDLAVAIESAS